MIGFYAITVQEGQSVLDISIQEYGSPEAALMLMRDNTLTGITQTLNGGDVLQIRQAPEVANKSMMRYFRDDKIKVNSQGGMIINISNNNEFDYILPFNLI